MPVEVAWQIQVPRQQEDFAGGDGAVCTGSADARCGDHPELTCIGLLKQSYSLHLISRGDARMQMVLSPVDEEAGSLHFRDVEVKHAQEHDVVKIRNSGP